MNTVYTLSPTS